MLVSLDQLEISAERFEEAAQQGQPPATFTIGEEVLLDDALPGTLKIDMPDTGEKLLQRKKMLEDVSPEPVDFALERAIGENDSVYSNFVDLIVNAKRKVGRIAVKSGNRNLGYATGFMVAPNIMLTNWHVFKTIEEVADSEVNFFYELDITGTPRTPVTFKLRSDIFFHTDKALDYCFVGVNDTDLTGLTKIGDIGYIYLDPNQGKLGAEGKEELNIIHHPDGDYMQLSIRENLFTKLTDTSVWYETDTAPGSSGSPVFNDQWQIVALHHMGVAKRDDAGNYIDKDGAVIPVIGNQIDAARIIWVANEGIRISVILNDLFANAGDQAVLSSIRGTHLPVSSSSKTANIKNPVNTESIMENNQASVNISFPASLVEKSGTININISQGGMLVGPVTAAVKTESIDPLAEEIKLLEQTTDYANCKGYLEDFLGVNVPLPMPQNDLKRFIARVSSTDSLVLKYYHYSVLFHSVRMMPVMSAVNIDGDLEKRKDDTKRKDNWLRDTRLSFDIQLDDNYYRGSGFDRGHMSRREDANWGSTPEDAKRNADLTCMYTNACPQVAKLNQSSRKGLWGMLEKVVLEEGAVKEQGRTGKISVFNGPVFQDTDPVYGGIQIPLNFYKIVLWLTDSGDLKATAFKLSQKTLVGNIDFEQLDLNQNLEFKEYQCSIKSLHTETGINFSHLFAYDTFKQAGLPISNLRR